MSVYDDRIPTPETDTYEYAHCCVCGAPIDYCQGHGPWGDPIGYRILIMHSDGYHGNCHSHSDCHDIWGD